MQTYHLEISSMIPSITSLSINISSGLKKCTTSVIHNYCSIQQHLKYILSHDFIVIWFQDLKNIGPTTLYHYRPDIRLILDRRLFTNSSLNSITSRSVYRPTFPFCGCNLLSFPTWTVPQDQKLYKITISTQKQ